MAVNMRCPKCGSTNVQMSNEMNKHGCLFIILFGWACLIWILIKWLIGLILLIFLDRWVAIIKAVMKKAMCGNADDGFPTEEKFAIVMTADIISERNFKIAPPCGKQGGAICNIPRKA